jgi:excisionase family DNA binding protein
MHSLYGLARPGSFLYRGVNAQPQWLCITIMRRRGMSRILYRPSEAAEQLSLGITATKALIRTGELRSVKIGRSRRVPADALHEYVQRLDAEQNGNGAAGATATPSENPVSIA